jgi:hypothetical protein
MKKNAPFTKVCPHMDMRYASPVFQKHFLLLFTLLVLSFHFSFAQTKTISGMVKDENGDPLQGVSVVAKGSSKGVVSAPDGKFSITVLPDTKSLVLSYVGYTTQEITLTGTAFASVSMQRDAGILNDVVVIGYGTTKRKDFTGRFLP